MRIALVTAPASEPVTLTEAKAHLRVTTSADDTYISSLITAARIMCEKASHVDFVTQTRDVFLDSWPGGFSGYYPANGSTSYVDYNRRSRTITLPTGPVQSVSYVKYYDTDGNLQTFDTSSYNVTTGDPCRVGLGQNANWPNTAARVEAIQIRYVSGFGDVEDVPATVRQAILFLVGHWYEHRENVVTGTISTELPWTVEALLNTVTTGKELFC